MIGSKTLFLVLLAAFSTIALGSSIPSIDRSRRIHRVGLRGYTPEKIDAVETSEIDNDYSLEDHEALERMLHDSITTDHEINSLISEEESKHRRTRKIGKKKKHKRKITKKPGALKLWKKTKKLRKNQYGDWINGGSSDDSDDSEDLPHGTHPPHTPDPNDLFPPTETPGEVPVTPNPTAVIPPPPNLQPTSLPPGFTPPPNFNPPPGTGFPPGFGGPPEDFFPPGFGEPPGEEPMVLQVDSPDDPVLPEGDGVLREAETVPPGPEDFFTPGFDEGEKPDQEAEALAEYESGPLPPTDVETATPPPTDDSETVTLPPNVGGDAMLSPDDPVILFSKAEGQPQGEREQEPDQSSIRNERQKDDNSWNPGHGLVSSGDHHHENIFNRRAPAAGATNRNKG